MTSPFDAGFHAAIGLIPAAFLAGALLTALGLEHRRTRLQRAAEHSRSDENRDWRRIHKTATDQLASARSEIARLRVIIETAARAARAMHDGRSLASVGSKNGPTS